ncbi:MAG: glucose-1-phosphate adenylyltransferase subunit GlgD [Anaerolineaceae bacterium 4572_78]|nr:MAG: glucose-1-phosphate adenylyltransferase subunit GlgD [Anaerolineaceae bacterium 4572_78]
MSVLTRVRSEGAIPFAGKFRIIDFPLSNCSNSEIYNVSVLTQYMPVSLNVHIGVGKPWELDRSRGGLRILHPYLGPDMNDGWQKGSADAVRKNLEFIDSRRIDTVLILGGNHVYKMDYRPMLKLHRDMKADVTVGIRSVNPFETHRFGIISTDSSQRVIGFREKPRRSRENVASMGVYIFDVELLKEHLLTNPSHVDFGRDVLPSLIGKKRVFAYKYEGYWANVGTIQAYWEANMALLAEISALDLYDPDWIIHTRSEEQPPAKVGPSAKLIGSLSSNGSIVEGTVKGSVISPGVHVAEGATVIDSVIMNDCKIESGAVLNKVILDKEVIVGENANIGTENGTIVPNKLDPDKINAGITVIGKRTQIPAGIQIGHNVVIAPYMRAEHFPSDEIADGETIR